MKGIYIIEDSKFNKRFKGYHLYKVGHSSYIEERLRSMPNSLTNTIVKLIDLRELYEAKDSYRILRITNKEDRVKDEFIQNKNVLIHPFKNKYELRHYHYEVNGMYDYLFKLKDSKRSQYYGNWGPTEWFITKD